MSRCLLLATGFGVALVATCDPLTSAGAAPAQLADDATRCAQLRRAIERSTDLAALRGALLAGGAGPGISRGETAEVHGKLLSFCVLVSPPLSARACLPRLGLERPVATPGLTQKKRWLVQSSTPLPGKPLATRATRLGPVAVIPTVADPPKGKVIHGSSRAFPHHEVDLMRDTIVELCFVPREIGEDRGRRR